MSVTPLSHARYSWNLLRAGAILLDGGGMFGVIPRALWSRSLPPDEQNRITLSHNCLLLRRADGFGAAGPVVIEAGSGNKFGPKLSRIFGLGPRWIATALQEAGCACESVENVIVTHLHFDHAGGLTCRTQPGKAPAWHGAAAESGAAEDVSLTFPNAQIIVQQREWEDARANRSVMTRTYLRENLEPIRDRLRLVKSPPPFAPGYVPDRDELPPTSVSERSTHLLPGIHSFLVPGHTWAQQAIRFTDNTGRVVVFVPDVMPTVHHLGRAGSLAYDVEPYVSSVTRRWLLDEAAREEWLLVLAHEPGNPLQRVKPDGKGWYALTPQEL